MFQKYYWGTTRKAVIAFGNLFNNIFIDRRDDSGNVVQTLKVPLSYAPKQKFIARIEAEPTPAEENFQVVLPRMAFEMKSVVYDPTRRVSSVQQSRAINSSTNTLNAQYSPSPYNVEMVLYLYARNQDDGLQVVEQIFPYFNPDYNLTLNAVPELGIKTDLPIVLNSVDYDDQYEGDFLTRRSIFWTLNFTVKLNYFGPINKQSIIRTVNVETYSDKALQNKQSRYEVTLNPIDAKLGDTDIAFTETFEDF
jgi:hypothetical protein